jgi:two-component system, NtrC family, sensor kinase
VKPAVLVVDDSLTVRMDLAEALEGAGLRVVLCASAAEARASLAAEVFPLVILDVLLPDGDGIELLDGIRRSERSRPSAVMMLSSEAEVRDRIRGLTTGADEYVGKPYERWPTSSRAPASCCAVLGVPNGDRSRPSS